VQRLRVIRAGSEARGLQAGVYVRIRHGFLWIKFAAALPRTDQFVKIHILILSHQYFSIYAITAFAQAQQPYRL
jgi:hypothetical protein